MVWREYEGESGDPTFNDDSREAQIFQALASHWEREETLEGDLILAEADQSVDAAEILLHLAEHAVVPTRDTVRLAVAAVRERKEREWEDEERRMEAERETKKSA